MAVTKDGPRERMLVKLKESALTSADAKKLHLAPMTEADCLTLGLSRAGEGFKIPYYDLDGKELEMFRYRYFDTEIATGFLAGAKQRKYDQPRNTDPEVYLPTLVDWTLVVTDPSIPVIITEGELKAACATKFSHPTIGVGGVYSFGRKSRHQAILPAHKQFKWQGRLVYICYDSDAVTNKDVMLAENRLARILTDAGAVVHVVRLLSEREAKVGIDDYIVLHGAEALATLLGTTPPWGPIEELHKLNTEVMYVMNPSMVAQFPKEVHPPGQPRYRMMKVQAFVNEAFATRKYVTYDENGKAKTRSAAADWIQWPARSAVDSVVYAPAEDVVVNGMQLNLWEGWGSVPVQGDVTPFIDLVNHIFRDSDSAHKRWFLQWLAYPLQHPGKKLNTAVVMWSITQGSGKSIIGYTLGKIYGHNFAEVTKPELSGSFNGWAANKQFIMGEEITGGSGREVADLLKNMITGRELTVNAKFQPTYTLNNCINYYFTSNHQDAFFINLQDRRYFIHEITGAKLGVAFWNRYDKWFKSEEGIAALFHYLLTVDLIDFNPQGEAPHTESRRSMIEAGLAEHAAWVHELREYPDNKLRIGDVVLPFTLFTIEDLLAIYDPPDNPRRKRISAKALAIQLKEAGFQKVNNGAAITTMNGMRQNVWAIRDSTGKLHDLGGAEATKLYNDERKSPKVGASNKFQRKEK